MCFTGEVKEQHTVGPHNGAADVLALLRDGMPRTRASLGSATGLSRTALSARIDELARLGLVHENVHVVATGGRPSTQIELVPASRLLLAADVGATHARIAITDLLGTILAEDSTALTQEDSPDKVVDWISSASQKLVESMGAPRTSLAVAGIGLASPIDRESQRPVNPPVMPRWNDFDVIGAFRERLGLPAVVEKDVNFMVVGERHRSFPDIDNMLFVKMSTGVGAGIVAGGQLQRGEQGTAGDIGHIRVSGAPQLPCHCGNDGCLEAVAGAPALINELRNQGIAVDTGSELIELVREGNLEAIRVVRQAGRYLGEVLASTVSMLNPAVVLIGGVLAQAGEHLLAGARETVYARSMPFSTQRLSIVEADRQQDSALIGAALMAADRALSSNTLGFLRSELD
jgi:predicted NBD/HSP70 family sugar kinase/biotin operon repressor